MTMRPKQLHVMLAPEELDALQALADGLGMNVSTTIRTLINAAEPTALANTGTLILDKRTFARYVRNVRALGHLLNQATHALNALAKIAREEGIEPLDLAEALEAVSYELKGVREESALIRKQAGELTGRPVVFE